jgi:hypothetical protein
MLPNITNAQKLARVKRLVACYEEGLIARLAEHEVNPGLSPGSRENYLYFTLPVCINFQRSSPAMWTAALRTYNDPETQCVFLPEQLAMRSIEQIRTDLTKHGLALQPNKHVLIWTTIASALHEFYHDDPRELIAEADSDARRLIDLLQTVYRKRFPYLSGPKLSNYWPYILSQFTDVQFANAHEISIIPDTHVLQSSVCLGVTLPGATQQETEVAWRELLQGSGLAPIQVHPVLWNWSRNQFLPSAD